MNSTKGDSKSSQENSRAEQGGLEGWGSGRSADDPRYAAPLRSATGRIHKLSFREVLVA